MCVLTITSVIIVLEILVGVEHMETGHCVEAENSTQHTHASVSGHRHKRALEKSSDFCVQYYGGLELKYTRGTNVTFQFDLCDVVGCSDRGCHWRGYDLYLCPDPKVNSMCGKDWYAIGEWCPWGWVTQWTGSEWTPSDKNPHSSKGRLISSIKFMRGQLSGSSSSTGTPGCNPLLLSIVGLTKNELPGKPHKGKLYFVLGVSQPGTDWKSLLKISILDPQVSSSTDLKGTPVISTTPPPQALGVHVLNYANLSRQDIVRIATGYGDRNMWLDWVTASALSMGMSNCVACSSARPTLFTTPAPLLPSEDPAGFNCMLGIHMTADPVNCTTFSWLFPPASNTSIPPLFTPRIGNYTCLTRSNKTWMGQMPTNWCHNTLNVTSWANASSLLWARADLFWYCGDTTLYNTLPQSWSGTCTLVRLALPVFMLGQKTGQGPPTREKREVSFDLTKKLSHLH